MIYFPIGTLLSCGVREIMIVTGPECVGDFMSLLGSGKEFGASFTYRVQDDAGGIAEALSLAEGFVGREKFAAILGDNVFTDSFGAGPGRHKLRVKCASMAGIIAEKSIDVAKFDCEGCEYGILGLKDEALAGIPYWCIEFHAVGKNRRKLGMIADKFRRCGFRLAREVSPANDIKICDFARRSDEE